jgi:hypothetical protein
MKTRLTLRPGSKGTRKLLAQYGKRLVCVRYKYDARLMRRCRTVELLLDEGEWKPRPPRPGTMVRVRIRFEEENLRIQIKKAGGRWDEKKRIWRLRYDKVVDLGLQNRIVDRPGI